MPFTLPEGVSLTWLGHSTFVIETPRAKRILIDPWVDNNPACPLNHHQLGRIDLMLISHGHFDHIQDALPVANATGCRVVGVFELVSWLMSKGLYANGPHRQEDLVFPMNKGGTLAFPDLGLSVTMVHADHTCGIKDGDHIVYGGEAVGYVVTLDDGFTFYHSGDTAVFGDMSLIADLYRPTLAMLPVGDRFVMSPKEAARAVELLQGVEAVIPMHFGTFPLLTGTPAAFHKALEGVESAVEVIELKPGEELENPVDHAGRD